MAQSTDGSIYGAVTDPSGAAIPGARVAVKDIHTGVTQSNETNSKGEYLFPTVKPSDYTVTVTAPGFKSTTAQGITVAANVNVHVPVALVIGGSDETVTVEAGVTLVDTREAQIGDTIDQAKVENLPTINRDTYGLLETVTGVQGYSADTLTGTRNGTTFSVNGFPADTPSFYLDGSYNNAFKANGGNKSPNPEALQEFRVITSNFDAEFGRSPGGVVNLISKSGGQHYHGDVYEYIRNDAFDANGFFNTTKATLRQNQYGATFGGPVPVLRKTFFFLSYEHVTDHTTDTQNSLITPTAAERAGDFSASVSGVKPTKLPATGTINGVANQPIQCGTTAAPKICAAALDPVAVKLLQFLPVNTGTVPQLRAPHNVSGDQGLARIDYQGFVKHSIYGTFFNAVGTTQDPTAGGNQIIGIPGVLPGFSAMSEYENQVNAILADDWTLTERTVNSVRGYYTSNRYIIGNSIPGHFLADLGSGAPEGGTIFSPPRFGVTGDFTFGPTGGGPSDINQLAFGLIDTATLQRGHHSIKIGASWDSNKYSEDGNASAQGVFNFNGGTTGSSIADFMLGYANTLTQSSSVLHRMRNQDPAVFVQDDWQATKRLNVNLGVRWEPSQAWLGDNSEGNVVPGSQSTVLSTAPAGILVVGDKGVPDGGVGSSYYRFAPRVGLAYDVYGDGRTSMRAGYGIFYNQYVQNVSNNLQQEPFHISQVTNVTPSITCPYGGVYTSGTCVGAITPFPFVYDSAHARFYTNTGLNSFRPGEQSMPYANEFNLTMEQQFSRQMALRVSYVGSTYMKQVINLDVNTPVFFPGAATNENPNAAPTTANPQGNNSLNCRRPYQPYRVGGVANVANCHFNTATSGGYTDAQGLAMQYSSINEALPINNQSYNSLQVNLHGKIKALNFSSSYVWGKALNFTTPTVDQSDIKKNHGVADIDQRNRFTFSGVYQTPPVQHFGLIGREILSGWNLTGIIVLHSGSPFTVMSQADTNRDGNNNDRVNVVGQPYRPRINHVDTVYNGYLIPSAFTTPCGATVDPSCTNPYGNEQRNQLVNEPDYRSNLGAAKVFALYREVRFQFRAEAFNIFNYTHLTSVRNNLPVLSTAPNSFQSADAPRRMQFSAKIMF